MVKIESISVAYGKDEILHQVSLSVAPGEVVALLGHNGAGKTTLLKTVAGLIEPSGGFVSLSGSIGYVPDRNGFYSRLPVLDNLAFRASLAGVTRADATKGINRLVEEFELKGMKDKAASSLSHGMARRLAICCALVGEPDILLLDEPTNGLDPIANELMGNSIKTWARQGKSILMSSHDLHDVVRSCDRGCILRRGSAVWFGPIAEKYEELRGAYFRFAGELDGAYSP